MPLRLKVWIHFVLFTILVFVLMWIFQIFFLESFYEGMKTRSVTENAVEIVDAYNTDYKSGSRTKFVEKYTDTANDVCVEILDRYGRSIYSKDVLGDCLVHGKENSTYKFMNEIRRTGLPEALYKVTNPTSHTDMLIYICVLGSVDNPEGYLLINAELAPVSSTVSIIKRQLVIITVLLILIAAVISVFLANRISHPIDRITKSAENLAKGDLNTKFDGTGYLEAQSLLILSCMLKRNFQELIQCKEI